MFFFFFFQAEDGIRDLTVTGVQTCALPICFCRSCLDLTSESFKMKYLKTNSGAIPLVEGGVIIKYDGNKSERKRVHRKRHPALQKALRKGGDTGGAAQTGTLREAERQEKKEGD